MDKVNLAQKLSLFQDYWSPKIVGELNDSYVKLAKLKGEFVWHHHETEDELFLVAQAGGLGGFQFGPGQSRQKQSGQNGNDGDDDEQFDECKRGFLRRQCGSGREFAGHKR